jgi:hypothetical protein
MISEFQVSCPFCMEPIWMEFYIQDGEKQEMIIDCEVCCRPIKYSVDFSNPEDPVLSTDRS